MSDLIIIRCRACGSEGRIYHSGYAIDYRTGDEIGGWSEPCPDCDGTGGEMIEGEPITLDDLIELEMSMSPGDHP